MKNKLDKIFLLILVLATLVRLYAFFSTHLISRDSPFYLYQAMAVSTGNFELLNICDFSSRIKELNFFSLSIIPFYYMFNDWEIAGKFLSFFSSVFSLILLYFILKNFFTGFPLYLTLLTYALNPIIVRESSEILRESYFTFLVLCGIIFFIRGLKSSFRIQFPIFFLSIFFWILSSWVRVEGIFLIFLSWAYLLLKNLFSENKKETLPTFISFSIIFFAIGFFIILYIGIYKSFLLVELKGKLNLLNPFTQSFLKVLKNFKYFDIPMPTPYFWDMVAQNLWLIAFGTTFFYKFIPALHFSNFILLLFGFKNIKNFLKLKHLSCYFLFLSFFYFLGLWYFTFTKWYMEKRYMLPLVYFVSPFVGFGIINFKNFLESRYRLSFQKILFIFIFYIVIFSFIKLFHHPYRKDLLELKIIAFNIANLVSEKELKTYSQTNCTNFIFTREGRIFFYISNYKKIPFCPKSENRIFYAKLQKVSDEEIVKYIVSKGYKIAVLETEVFKERTKFLKEKLENFGIKTYILSN